MNSSQDRQEGAEKVLRPLELAMQKRDAEARAAHALRLELERRDADLSARQAAGRTAPLVNSPAEAPPARRTDLFVPERLEDELGLDWPEMSAAVLEAEVRRDCELGREEELAARLVAWLEARGYLVFAEVRHLGRIADIVAVDEAGFTLVVEVKASAGLDLLEQARFWQESGTANRVAIAAPFPTTPRLREFTLWLCREHGFGAFEIADHISALEHARFFGQAVNDWPITGAHQTKARAGTQSGPRVSTRSTTADLVLAYVLEHEGASYAEVLAGARLPIGKGRQAEKRLADMVRRDEIPGVRRSKLGGAWRLFPEDSPLVRGSR